MVLGGSNLASYFLTGSSRKASVHFLENITMARVSGAPPADTATIPSTVFDKGPRSQWGF